MTPASAMALPVKAGEATALAELIFEHTEGRTLNAGVRGRLAGRIAALGLTSMAPLPGSLQRDPIHPSTFYLAVDPVAGDPVLLRLALASSPSSGLFPNAQLIGRMRTESGREVVVNAIRFARADHENIGVFASQVDRDFLPRAGTNSPGILTRVGSASKAWHSTVWEAIRAGRRNGWTATISFDPVEVPAGALLGVPDFTCLSVRLGAVTEAALAGCEQFHGLIRQFELDLTGTASDTTPDDVAACLQHFRSKNKPVQFIAPRVPGRESAEFEARVAALVDAARASNAVVRLDGAADQKLAGLRVQYRGTGEVPQWP